MIKVIYGTRYNTDTAEELASYCNGQMGHTYKYEVVYRTKKGQYFFYGYGGALTEYGERCPEGLAEGKIIIPLSEDEAMDRIEELKQKG